MPQRTRSAASSRYSWVVCLVALLPTAHTGLDALAVLTEDQAAAITDWQLATPMNTPRLAPGAAFGSDGLVYAIGGRDLSERVLSSVERYDPASKT